MSIDWFTFAAQVVNFLILIWLLQRFLYGPVVRMMTERQTYIADQFAAAEQAQADAAAKQQEYENRLQELTQTKETMVASASQEVEQWTAEQLVTAKADVENSRKHWQQELQRDKQALLQELQLDVTHHAVELGRHILQELSDQALLSRLVERFIDRLNKIDLSSLQSSIDRSSETHITVVSSHELSESDQSLITTALTPLDQQVDFTVNPRLICGIELQTPDCRFTWSLQEAMAEVESDLIDAIEKTLPARQETVLQNEPTDVEQTTS